MDACHVKLVVIDSQCGYYRRGDEIEFDGPLLVENGTKLCMTALQALYPFVFAARQGAAWEHLIQCPDCDDKVTFKIISTPISK